MLPKFILGDHSEFPDSIFVIHTEYPRFIINLENDEITWFDDLEGESEEELTAVVAGIVEEAQQFYDREIERYS